MLTVVSPIEDTPAYKAGVKAGDQIVKINDDFTKDMTLTDAVKRMRGPQGSKIHLTIHRKGVPELFTVSVTREVIKIKSSRPRNCRTATATSASAVSGGHRRRSAKGAGQIPCAA